MTYPKEPIVRLPYGLIWLIGALSTVFGTSFLVLVDMGTAEFFKGADALMWFSLLCLLNSGFFVAIGTGIFFLTKRFIKKREVGLKNSFFLLAGPPLLTFLILFSCGLWDLTPRHRLASVCGATVKNAHDIKVVGCTGMQMAQWMAAFKIEPQDFQKLVLAQQLQPDSDQSFQERLDKAVMLRNTSLFASIPVITNELHFKKEVTGSDGYLHGGVYAAYDAKTSIAIVLNEGY